MSGTTDVGKTAAVRDPIYDDARLVALYDALNPVGPDTEFYVQRAAGPTRAILDIGCGTGQLALRLAHEGHRVTGLDPAPAMLDVARHHDTHHLVDWIDGDMQSLPADARFDLAIMSGHVFQVFLDDTAVAAALAGTRQHLEPGGELTFETRNPAVRSWESWTPEQSRRTVHTSTGEAVVVEHHLGAVTGELIEFTTTYRFTDAGETLRSDSTLRFIGPDALCDHLDAAGFTDVTLYGDWDGGTCTPASPEIIVVATAP